MQARLETEPDGPLASVRPRQQSGQTADTQLDAVLMRLGIVAFRDSLATEWDAALAHMPGPALQVLSPEYLLSACEAASLPPAMRRAVLRTGQRIAADEDLRALAWWCHYRLFRATSAQVSPRDWPLLTNALGRDAGLFNVVVLLSGTRQVQAFHRARKIPPDVVKDTLLDLKLCMETEDYYESHGVWGISPGILSWLLHHWRGNLYKLGRLQFLPGTFRGSFRLFRHRARGTVVALAENGARFRSDEELAPPEDQGAWRADLHAGNNEIAGYPLTPDGRLRKRFVWLLAGDWEPVLAPGDPVLTIHIPTGAPLDFEACGESLRSAVSFFPTFFPDRPFRAITCASWIMSNQFENLLCASSNLVRFQKEFYLLPGRANDRTVIRQVFGRNVTDIATAPRKTSMQRAFAAFLRGGGHFHYGMAVLLPCDLRWGEQVYRKQHVLRSAT
ncbi:MAG: DUF5596 domain-containing protein [Kiritimatiellae bacterium]|nr:DUF5596 domain-containing protein [Kiritimatiellia bacterium]